MAWRFNETVPLVLTRQEASELYEALTLYRNECDLDDVSTSGIDAILTRMKRHTEHRSTQEKQT